MTDTVLAALDATLSSRVLGFATLLASGLESRVCALRVVGDNPSDAVSLRPLPKIVDLYAIEGDPVRGIVRTAHHPEIGLVVIGANEAPHGVGLGQVACEVAARVRRPLLVVPAEAVVPTRIERVLIPLAGTEETSAPIRALFKHSPFHPGTELVTVHAYTTQDVPRLANHEPHDTEEQIRAFRERYGPANVVGPVVTPYGPPEVVVPEAAARLDATLTVVSWSQDLTANRALLVKALLAHPSRPTLLVPLDYRRAAEPVHDQPRPDRDGLTLTSSGE